MSFCLANCTGHRLWAASGQAALESARVLVTSADATSTSVLKNLVLPGIGHFTILDPLATTPADAGNNFFLNADASIGKPRAAEAVPLLNELNESVEGVADTRDLMTLLDTEDGKEYIKSFSLVIVHNLAQGTLDKLAALLWEDPTYPPLIAVRSAGFIADFYVQLHEHCGRFHQHTSSKRFSPPPISHRITQRNCTFTPSHETVPGSSRMGRQSELRFFRYDGPRTYTISRYTHQGSRPMESRSERTEKSLSHQADWIYFYSMMAFCQRSTQSRRSSKLKSWPGARKLTRRTLKRLKNKPCVCGRRSMYVVGHGGRFSEDPSLNFRY